MKCRICEDEHEYTLDELEQHLRTYHGLTEDEIEQYGNDFSADVEAQVKQESIQVLVNIEGHENAIRNLEKEVIANYGKVLTIEFDYQKPPTPSDDEVQNFTCEDCGAEIPAGHERRMKDGDTILCGECAKKHPDDYFL